MTKVKKETGDDGLPPYVVDISDRFHYENKCTVGCGIGYSIRNHTTKTINVRSRLGFSQNIEPYTDTYSSKQIPEELKKDSVWLDIHLYFDDLNGNFNLRPESSNTLDNVIIREVKRQIGAAVHSEHAVLLGFSTHISICLNALMPNYHNNGFQSDLFNFIIQYDTAYQYKDILSHIPSQFIDHLKDNQIDFSCATYQLTMLVDNQDECDNLWMMQAGKPEKLVPVKNTSMSSGLYIFLNKYHIRDKPYLFIAIDELKQNDNKLREYGLSYTEKEAIETARTADYVALKKAYDKQENEHSKLTLVCEKKQQGLIEAKANHERTLEKVERVTRELSVCTEEKKTLTSINNGLNKDLERVKIDVEKLKREIIDKEDKNRDLKDTIRSMKHRNEIEAIKQHKKGSWTSHFLAQLGETFDLIKKVGGLRTLLIGMT